MRFVVDAGTLLHLLAEDIEVSDEIRLVAPTLVRSQVLSALFEAVQRGEISQEVGRDRLARFGAMKMRLLGDQVLRRRAWAIAEKMGWDSTYVAEYVSLTQLQADAFVTMDVGLPDHSKESSKRPPSPPCSEHNRFPVRRLAAELPCKLEECSEDGEMT